MARKEIGILILFIAFIFLGALLAPKEERSCIVSVKYLPIKTPLGGFRGHEDHLGLGDTSIVYFSNGGSIVSVCVVEDTVLINAMLRLK